MGAVVIIPYIGGQNNMGRGQYTMEKGFDAPWIGSSIYHG